MNPIFNNKNLIERADQLIRLKATGTPEEFAGKLNISKRSMFRLINNLKEIGCPIIYNSHRRCYEYESEGKLLIKFVPKGIESIHMDKIKGGNTQNYLYTESIIFRDILYIKKYNNQY